MNVKRNIVTLEYSKPGNSGKIFKSLPADHSDVVLLPSAPSCSKRSSASGFGGLHSSGRCYYVEGDAVEVWSNSFQLWSRGVVVRTKGATVTVEYGTDGRKASLHKSLAIDSANLRYIPARTPDADVIDDRAHHIAADGCGLRGGCEERPEARDAFVVASQSAHCFNIDPSTRGDATKEAVLLDLDIGFISGRLSSFECFIASLNGRYDRLEAQVQVAEIARTATAELQHA